MRSTVNPLWLLSGGILLLIYLLSPVLAPFLIGALFAYLGDPWVDRLEKIKHISRTTAVLSVFSIMTMAFLAVLVLLIPAIQEQTLRLIGRLPGDIQRLREVGLPFLGIKPTQIQYWLDLEQWKHFVATHSSQAGGVAAMVMDYVSQSSKAVIGWMFKLFVIPVVTFYLLRDWDDIVAHVRNLLPRRIEPLVSRLTADADEVLGSFLRGQLAVMAALAFIYSMGLTLIGIDGAFVFGFIAGLISFVPYVGAIGGLLITGIACLIQFQDGLHLMYVSVVFGLGQVIEGMVLTPLLVGDRIGLHPVAVIFAVLAGEQLFGFAGVLLALPAAAVIMVLLRYAHAQYLDSKMYQRDPSGKEPLHAAENATIE